LSEDKKLDGFCCYCQISISDLKAGEAKLHRTSYNRRDSTVFPTAKMWPQEFIKILSKLQSFGSEFKASDLAFLTTSEAELRNRPDLIAISFQQKN
jgi:hypothetical protein